MKLLWRTTWRHWRRHPLQSGLALFGVALGVAVVVAVDLANDSARHALTLSVEGLGGGSTHRIVAVTGDWLDENWYTRLRTETGITGSAPVVEAAVEFRARRLQFTGVDPFAGAGEGGASSLPQWRELMLDKKAVAMSTRTARRLDLELGSPLLLQHADSRLQTRLRAVIDAGGPALDNRVLVDIATAQDLLGVQGRLSRIELKLDQKQERRLRAWLPAGLVLQRVSETQSGLGEMTSSFHTNLTAMSLLALAVGALLIFNTVNFQILQRRRDFGVLRGLGVDAARLRRHVLASTLALAAVGSLAGVIAGIVLAASLVDLVTRTVDDLYFRLHMRELHINGWSLLRGMALGCGTAVLAALAPAHEAAQIAPVSLQLRNDQSRADRRTAIGLWSAGILLLCIGFWLASREHGSLNAGFVALALLLAGFSLLVAPLLRLMTRTTNFFPALPPATRLASAGIARNLRRTGPAAMALTLAVATTLGVGLMISSFRQSVDTWLLQILAGDLYLRAEQPLSSKDVEAVRSTPGVRAVDARYRLEARIDTQPLSLRVWDTGAVDVSRAKLVEGDALAQQRWLNGEGVFVSEPLAWRRKLQVGDTLAVHMASGSHHWSVLGLYTDYGGGTGGLSVTRSALPDGAELPGAESLVIYAEKSVSLESLQRAVDMALATELASHNDSTSYELVANSDIRQRALALFDRTFLITGVLRTMTVMVAFAAVFSALLALQLERLRELAVLRAIGMSQQQVAGLTLQQALILGMACGILALPVGLTMADVLIDVINRRSFGWSITHSVPPRMLLEAFFLAVAASALAGIYPAWRAGRGSIAAPLARD